MNDKDNSKHLRRSVKEHVQSRQPINITGGDSKQFYGREPAGKKLSVLEHSGILMYEPTELVIKARCGTPLSAIKETLAEQNQMLAFEPPSYSDRATIGGCIATGLSGPRRPYTGAARDYVLGASIINGKAEILKFGGEVMKNVAGYDVSRLMTGAMGSLGLILDVSIKVVPMPQQEVTVYFELTERAAITRMNKLMAQSYPISATSYFDSKLYLRLSGSESLIQASIENLGAKISDDNELWNNLNEHKLDFFNSKKTLWRLSVAPATDPIDLGGEQLIEWGGAQRWLSSDNPQDDVRDELEQLGGFADVIRNGDRQLDYFHPLSGKLRQLHMQMKLAFDPYCIFNPGRMSPTY